MENTFGIQSTSVGDEALMDDIFGNASKVVTDPKDITPIKDVEEKVETKTDVLPENKEVGKDDTVIKNDLIENIFGKEGEEPEKVEDELDKKVEDPIKDTLDEKVETSSQFESLAKDFFELGIWKKEEGEDETPITTGEQFLERTELEKKKGAIEILDNYLERFGEDYKEAFDAIYNKGIDPKTYFTAYNEIADYSALDLSLEPNQEMIVRKAMRDEGYEIADIDAKVQKLKDYSDLEEESKRVQKIVVKREQQKLDSQIQSKERQLKLEIDNKNLYNQTVAKVLNEKLKEKEFDGIPLNPQFAKDVNEFVTAEKWKLPDGKKITDFDAFILNLDRPENHVTKVKLAAIIKLLEKDPKFETIQKKGATKVTKELFSNTVSQKTTTKPGAPQGKTSLSAKWDL